MADYEKQQFLNAGCVLLWLAFGLVICIAITILTGCKTRYITTEVPVVLHERDSVVQVQHYHTHDTLLMRDSVFTIVKGDTIRIERWHTLQAVNHIARVDTLWRERAVEKPVTITKTEVRETNRLYWWQKTLMWTGGALLIFGGFKLYRRLS